GGGGWHGGGGWLGGWYGGWGGWGWGGGYPYGFAYGPYDYGYGYDYGYPYGYGYPSPQGPTGSPYCATRTRVCTLSRPREIGSRCTCRGAHGWISAGPTQQ
ncbi:MAG: hypothetical protein WBL57_03635, partial [Methylovirgula sp.]